MAIQHVEIGGDSGRWMPESSGMTKPDHSCKRDKVTAALFVAKFRQRRRLTG